MNDCKLEYVKVDGREMGTYTHLYIPGSTILLCNVLSSENRIKVILALSALCFEFQ